MRNIKLLLSSWLIRCPAQEEDDGQEGTMRSEAIDTDDAVQLGEEGWRARYYEQKFQQGVIEPAFVKTLVTVGNLAQPLKKSPL